jgi:2-keto-4-pentenoate hydratase/2-oxohepta-3-ene-1,7-dioic acid hydratase in catechol pathway
VKIARFTFKDCLSYGLIKNQVLVPLPAFAAQMQETLPDTLEEFIGQGQTAQVTVETLLQRAKENILAKTAFPLSNVKLLAPIAFPPKILCLGWNYNDHVAETKREVPSEPVVFMKPHTAIVGLGDKIVKRPFVKELDYEGEFAIVMGKRAKDVAESEALEYVFGYTILNDVSARDFQFKDKQWTRGKGFDTFAPTGPCIVTCDELPDTSNLSIRTWVNGELRQNGSTKDMIFNPAQIIYHLSRVMTLEPCDIIATGTPGGVGMAMNPQTWLKAGDTVEIQIENIGTLKNSVEEQ